MKLLPCKPPPLYSYPIYFSSSTLKCPHFRLLFINTKSAYIGVVGWGWWGAMPVAGKHVKKLNIQMGSDKTLLCFKYQKK